MVENDFEKKRVVKMVFKQGVKLAGLVKVIYGNLHVFILGQLLAPCWLNDTIHFRLM